MEQSETASVETPRARILVEQIDGYVCLDIAFKDFEGGELLKLRSISLTSLSPSEAHELAKHLQDAASQLGYKG